MLNLNKYGKVDNGILTLEVGTVPNDPKARYQFFGEIERYYAEYGYSLWSHNYDRRIYKLVPHSSIGSLDQTQDDFLAGTGRGL